MFSLILKGIELLLNKTSLVSVKRSQVPHWVLLQRFIFVALSLSISAGKMNLALVKILFKVGG